jgi:hypothetical protein
VAVHLKNKKKNHFLLSWATRSTSGPLAKAKPTESPSLVLVINDTKLLMPLCQVN